MFEHKDRIITGIILLAIVAVVGFIDNFFITWAFFGLVYVLAFKEALNLFKISKNKDFFVYIALFIWFISAFFPNPDDIAIIILIIYAALISYNKEYENINFSPFLYPTSGMLFILALYKSYGMSSLVWLLVVVALTDVGAYAVGKSIGKTKFSPTSPNKTLEGVIGGVFIATLGGVFAGLNIVDTFASFIVSFGVSIASVFGDLFESKLKREAGVKDSGDLLPGHGGVLDRIDGYLFGSIVMAILLRGVV